MLSVWSIDGNCVVHSRHPTAVNGPVAELNKFFSEQLSLSTFTKFGVVIENTAMHCKQYLFCISTQHIPSFLSIMLNWSIEGKFTVHNETACCVLKRKVTKRYE